jgi:cytochrome oxidase Cu insertion factor (SCO1/SenC/PrrC family)
MLLAFAWTVFGSNLLNDGYGLQRDKIVTSPSIKSTVDEYASIEDLNGYTTYLTFGFSHCAGNCPFTLAQYTKLAKILPKDTRLVFVSVDNERDDIVHLKNYLTQIDPSIIGWRIDNSSLQHFAEQFDTYVKVKSGDEPQHGSAIHLIDKEGRWVKTYPYLNLNEDAVLTDYLDLQEMTQTLSSTQPSQILEIDS